MMTVNLSPVVQCCPYHRTGGPGPQCARGVAGGLVEMLRAATRYAEWPV